MKRRLLLRWLTAALSLSLTTATTALPANGPAIHVPEPQHEFEAVPEGVEVRHDFMIRNRGGADLEIQKVETG